jgi:hypothetical protein
MRSVGRTLALTAVAVGLMLAASLAGEEKIPLDKVPPAVLKAFKTKFPAAKIKNAIKEEEDGKTVYEIESMADGLSIDAVLTPAGKFDEIEKEIKSSNLPSAVASAIKAKHPGGKVTKAEEVTRGTKFFYEVVVEGGGKSTDMALDKNGKDVK